MCKIPSRSPFLALRKLMQPCHAYPIAKITKMLLRLPVDPLCDAPMAVGNSRFGSPSKCRQFALQGPQPPRPKLWMVRETVAVETPARFATCRMSIVCVIRRLRRTLILVAIARP